MKILIIGAGIGGLSAYHPLRKHLIDTTLPIEIKVYESHNSPASTTSIIGGGLGLAPNGLRAIASTSPSAAEYIQDRGFGGGIFTFRNSVGTLLGHFYNGTKERYGVSQVILPRATVHEALLLNLPEGAVMWGKKVRLARETEHSVEVEFTDGSVESADLIIGADGVRSIVREAIFGKQFEATYDGFTGVGGFVPVSCLSPELQEGLKYDPVTMTWGAQGLFGYGRADPDDPPRQVMWWSTYETSSPPGRDAPLADIHSQLLARHGSWKSPYDSQDASIFRTFIDYSCLPKSHDSSAATAIDNGLLILPRYITPRLPGWTSSSGRIMLLGDAAHAMPPDAGQGVSCAVEDAAVIGLLLKHFTTQQFEPAEALKRTARSYEELRMKRVHRILDVAERRRSNKLMRTWWQELLRDWIMWFLCKLPEFINDKTFTYDAELEVARYLTAQMQ